MERKLAEKRTERASGLELLKILAIVLIVLFHVVQTLSKKPILVFADDFVVNLKSATADPKQLLLSILRYSGILGNMTFFICSAWFLLGRTGKNEKPKILRLLADNWTISVCIFSLFFAARVKLGGSFILRSFFPFLFENNWYLNCYVMFLLLYPTLNRIMEAQSEKAFVRCTGFLILCYLLSPLVFKLTKGVFNSGTDFFASELIQWVASYYTIAFLRRFMPARADSARFNVLLMLLGFAGVSGSVLAADFVGLRIGLFSDVLQVWANNGNPFLLMMAIGLVNLARNWKIRSAVINYVASLSLFIYLSHENLLVRSYLRPVVWQWIYERFGYDHILAWVFAQVAVYFALALLLSILYRHTLHPIVVKCCDRLYPRLAAGFRQMENGLLGKLRKQHP